MSAQNSTAQSELEKIDSDIRFGRLAGARSTLIKISSAENFEKKYSSCLSLFAQLCWRAGIADLGLLKLSYAARSGERLGPAALPDRVAEYAACLLNVGADFEAEELLKNISLSDYPRAHLYLAFIYFGRWEYETALPYLEKLLAINRIDTYFAKIVKVNYASALIALERGSVRSVLSELKTELSPETDTLLRATYNILRVQDLVLREKYSLAKTAIDQGLKYYTNPESQQPFLLKKWEAIAALRASNGKVNQLAPLRAEAQRRKMWESVRQMDFFEAEVLGDPELIKRLYFGSPYSAYKGKIRKLGKSAELDFREYTWIPQPKKSVKGIKLFDLGSGCVDGHNVLKCGFQSHRLLQALASDFYRPHRLASLHEKLFRGRFYNPNSSPQLMHQIFRRLRRQLADSECPFLVEESGGFYSIQADAKCAFKFYDLSTVSTATLTDEARVEALRTGSLAGRRFAVEEAAQLWAIGPRRARDILLAAVESGKLDKFAFGKRLRFEFLDLNNQ
jgi:tetratricopeptide (TPR) repeat protein